MITLYSKTPRIKKLVRDAAAGHTSVRIREDTDAYPLPAKWDYVVTTAALNAMTERWAAQRSALILVFPEAADFLSEKAAVADSRGDELIIVGTDHMGSWKK